TLAGTGAESDWAEAAWSDYRGWPRSIIYFQQRLIFGGNSHEKEKIWGTAVGNIRLLQQDDEPDVYNVDTKIYAQYNSGPFGFTLSYSQQINQIQWLSVFKNLVMGTLGDE